VDIFKVSPVLKFCKSGRWIETKTLFLLSKKQTKHHASYPVYDIDHLALAGYQKRSRRMERDGVGNEC
jgi:hypothetical protein